MFIIIAKIWRSPAKSGDLEALDGIILNPGVSLSLLMRLLMKLRYFGPTSYPVIISLTPQRLNFRICGKYDSEMKYNG